MQPGEKVFLAEHFNDLIKTEAENALDTLKGMTGLKNLKNAVREYIAVRNEMRRNAGIWSLRVIPAVARPLVQNCFLIYWRQKGSQTEPLSVRPGRISSVSM